MRLAAYATAVLNVIFASDSRHLPNSRTTSSIRATTTSGALLPFAMKRTKVQLGKKRPLLTVSFWPEVFCSSACDDRFRLTAAPALFLTFAVDAVFRACRFCDLKDVAFRVSKTGIYSSIKRRLQGWTLRDEQSGGASKHVCYRGLLASAADRNQSGGPMCRSCFGLACILAIFLGSANHSLADVPRVGLLTYWDCDSGSIQNEFGPFLKGLEELGYRRGETLALECQGAGQNYDGLAEAARELVQLPVDVIVTTSQPAGRAAYQVTKSVPIVSVVSGDPISDGLVVSLAKPGGNFTGVSYYATELTAKRLELLKEAIPGLTTIGVLANPDVSYLPFEADTMRAADKLGVSVKLHHVRQPEDIDVAIPEMKKESVQAIFVLPDVMLAGEAGHIAGLALEQRLPTMTWGLWYPRAGCLMAYSADYVEMIHRLAFYADRILKGANPGDLPLEQPATFLLTINQKTAAALGLELPQTLLILADEVIE